MGSVQLVLNIDRVDLIIAISVMIIALVGILGFIVWLVRSGRQNKTLRDIDNKLTPAKPDLIIREIIKTEKAEESLREKEKVQEKIEVLTPVKDARIAEDEDEEDIPDVLEEIRKMMISGNDSFDLDKTCEKFNIGKSGKTYTREELEKLIND